MSGQISDSRTRTRTEANRANARKSTGPKDTTSTRFNAVKHGLLAEGVTELDKPETFQNFCAAIEAELKPLGEIENFLARQIVLCMVRLKRVRLLEAEFVTAQLNPPVMENFDTDIDRILGNINNQTVVDPGLPARLSAEAVDALANSFARYETAIENRMLRALNHLERMQLLRHAADVPKADEKPLASFGNPPQLQEETAP
jgi:hypothetical protein